MSMASAEFSEEKMFYQGINVGHNNTEANSHIKLNNRKHCYDSPILDRNRLNAGKPEFNFNVEIVDDVFVKSDLDEPSLWVFGYGSLMWKTCFEYTSKEIGYIRGYSRRFWQGSVTHRGTKSNPGLVATLVPDQEGITWGVAFHLVGKKQIDTALDHLGVRECSLGGYASQLVPFYPQDDHVGLGIHAMTYYASPHNNLYVGSKSEDELAQMVLQAVGLSGHNVEYVIRTAEYVRKHIPTGYDSHLKILEETIRENCNSSGRNIEELIRKSAPAQDWTLLSTKSKTRLSSRRNSNRA